MTPLAELHRFLERREVEHALIGALAMAIHGHTRAALAIELLALDRVVLKESFWSPLVGSGWVAEGRLGEFEDPLAGSATLTPPEGEITFGVVVGRWTWQREIVERAAVGVVLGVRIPVVGASDLVLLALDAGGAQDLNDVRALVEMAEDRDALEREVGKGVERLGPAARAAWRTVVETA